MKYMRKTPVEAIQWRPDNRKEFGEFVGKYTKDYATFEYTNGNILLCYWDFNSRKHITEIPKFGWVVREGKTFQFYKDTTFHKTFDEVPDDDSKKIIDAILKNAEEQINAKLKGESTPFMDNLYKAIFDNPSQSVFAKYDNLINPDGRLTKLIDDLYKNDEKKREEIKKNMAEGLKEMEDSDKTKGTEFDTFESVLDEMKELHAKKDKDYNESFHNLFKEYGMSYALGHIEEKLNRVKAIIANGGNAVKNEHIEDSLIDGACYNILTLIELRNGKH